MDMTYTLQAEPEGQGQGSSDVMSCLADTASFSFYQGFGSESVAGVSATLCPARLLDTSLTAFSRTPFGLGLFLCLILTLSPLHLAYGAIGSLETMEREDPEVGRYSVTLLE